MNRTDALYVRAFGCGNERLQRECYLACRETFASHPPKMQASDDDLKDIFHESFEILWNNIDKGIVYVEGSGVKARNRHGETSTVKDLTGAYFSGIIRHKYLEYCRDKGRIIPVEKEIADDESREPRVEESDDDIELAKERLTVRALNSLARSCIDILTKFYHESKSLEDILAERPENNSYDGLKTRKSKCLKNLKEKIITSFKAHGLTCP